MKVLLMSASNLGKRCLDSIFDMPMIELIGIVTTHSYIKVQAKKVSTLNVHYRDFSKIASQKNLPIIYVKDTMKNSDITAQILSLKPDIILVIGWYIKIPNEIISIPSLGTIGVHAALLPQYRGGAPLVWAMINGEKKAGISLFYFTDKLDAGDIIAQRSFPIRFCDSIADVYERMENTAIDMLQSELPKLAYGTASRTIQDETSPFVSMWPNRVPNDGLIDWNQSALDIYNFIRAQSRPYPGAFTYFKGNKIYIWQSMLIDAKNEKQCGGEIISITNSGGENSILVSTINEDYPLLLKDFSVDGKSKAQILDLIQAGDKFEQ